MGNFENFLGGIIRQGAIEVVLPDGRRVRAGDGGEPQLIVRIAERARLAAILLKPSLGLGEGYMDGDVTFERGAIADLLALAARNSADTPLRRRAGLLRRVWSNWVRRRNSKGAARRNAAHHYDLSIELYRRFLDEDLQYSCAYFERPGMSLEEAQRAKKRHIAAKLRLAPGQRVLDIGCGWGGLALSLTRWAEVKVDGVTLSAEQLAAARARAEAAGLSSAARFSLTDYRDVEGPYDRIVSVGMFEHVGAANYQTYFDQVARLLADDGVALIHSIGRAEGPSTTDAFTAKYIFPGGYIPALSEVIPAVERAGLKITDIEILRLHYADTLKAWRERFMANRAAIANIYDERFCRMWEFYLAGAEMGFRYGPHMVFQLQLAKSHGVVPITRDYIGEAERALKERPKIVA
ncbi:MAG TPA: cyclopropane-fatty-acyl-phospholipid synthase family protein [Caulobacteraceae bacterium]|nr:cyclopropane-fatty-acyl-phospholipid synthase family protein [Caulobacteraceae bacterium]